VIRLWGTVTLRGAGPARFAVVELHNADGDILDQVQVDERGRYVYHVPPGRWGLRVWDAAGHRASEVVAIDGGEEKVVDLDLRIPEEENA
jgi:hypothetical protein